MGEAAGGVDRVAKVDRGAEVDREAKVELGAKAAREVKVAAAAEGEERAEPGARAVREAEAEVTARRKVVQKAGRENLNHGAAAAKGVITKKARKGRKVLVQMGK